MSEIPDGVRGAIAQARLAIDRANKKPRRKRSEYVPENDAITREEIEEARA